MRQWTPRSVLSPGITLKGCRPALRGASRGLAVYITLQIVNVIALIGLLTIDDVRFNALIETGRVIARGVIAGLVVTGFLEAWFLVPALWSRAVPVISAPATATGRPRGFRPGIAAAPAAIPVVPVIIGKELILERAKGVLQPLERAAVLTPLTGKASVEAVDGFLKLTDR